jgi:hypothetical protein
MPIEIVTTSCDPTNPIAGETFVLNIELNSPAPKDLTVVLEKQRVVGNVGGGLPSFGRPGRIILICFQGQLSSQRDRKLAPLVRFQ